MRIANALRALALTLSVAVAAGPSLRADMILQQYEFQGQAGNETFLAPSVVTTGLTGMNFTETSALTASAGVNSINASGWSAPAAIAANSIAYYLFGFSVGANLAVTVDQLTLTSRSSGTGPGTVDLLASDDGGAFTKVATITQTSTNYNDELLSITSVTARQSLVFRFVVDPTSIQASGSGAIASAGTFRVGDYDPTGAAAPTPFTITGTITPAAGGGGTGTGGGGGTVAVPEPASVALLGLGLVGGLVVARRRAAR